MKRYTLLVLLVSVFGCSEKTTYQATLSDPESYRSAVQVITDVIVYDIFSPPVASRVYAYSNIAGYETLAGAMPGKLRSLENQINGFRSPPSPEKGVDPHLASIHALLKVGQALIFSEERIEAFREGFYQRLSREGLPEEVKAQSLAYGDQVARHVLEWAGGDMYKQTRSYPKYTVREEDPFWKPTPPDFIDGIEPHWKEIRPLVLDSADQFPPIPPVAYSMDKTSEFYKQLWEVYDTGVKLDSQQTDIAKFWDCNPFVSHHAGHAMFATKKISPGGHWMGITAIASRMAKSDFEETAEVFTRTSVALFDAFISCWTEKWRSLVVRPETLISQYIDPAWRPLLQTPPFPEYTSGHSVISRAAAITLTDFYGENFTFHDTTEVAYGLPARDFSSFLQASEEAAISRLYGGIHYRMAIENGVQQGEKVGRFIVANLDTSPEQATASIR